MELSTSTESTKPKTKKVKKVAKKDTDASESNETIINEINEIKEEIIVESVKEEDEKNEIAEEQTEETSSDSNVTLEVFSAMKTISEQLAIISKHSVKTLSIDKEFLMEYRNIIKKLDKFSTGVTDILVVESLASIKKKDAKKMKSKSTTKKASHVTTPSETYDFILNFMNKPLVTKNAEGVDEKSKVSKSEIMSKICDYVRDNKLQLEDDKKTFELKGDLNGLFSKIKENMKSRGKITPEIEVAKQVKYTQLMTYLTYCFPEKPKK
jgi:hypothetical protein